MSDPTAPENIGSGHGRGIYLMKAFMDEVRFEEGGVVVHYAKEGRPRYSQGCTEEPARVA